MIGLMDGFCTQRIWSALVGLMLALVTGTAAFDTGAYSVAPTAALAAPLPDLSIDRLVGATQPPGAADPAGRTPRPADEQRERATSAPPSPVADPAATARIQQGYGRLPMQFEPNQSQSADAVRYLARGAGYSLFLTDTEAVLVRRRGRGRPAGTGVRPEIAAGAKLRSLRNQLSLASQLSPRLANPLVKPFGPLAASESSDPTRPSWLACAWKAPPICLNPRSRAYLRSIVSARHGRHAD